MSTPAAYFDTLYRDQDPYGYDTRWYEARKRALTLAILPFRRYANAWEVGCSIGVTTEAIAARCDRLLATDGNDAALQRARVRLDGTAHVHFEHAAIPRDWPKETFDLIVFSEVGYFLGLPEMTATARAFTGSLGDRGVLVACHWKRGFAEASLDGPTVHRVLHEEARMASVARYEDDDFILEAWCAQPVSLAHDEGLA